jgi:hypothetical protein
LDLLPGRCLKGGPEEGLIRGRRCVCHAGHPLQAVPNPPDDEAIRSVRYDVIY